MLERAGVGTKELPMREADERVYTHRVEIDGQMPAEVGSALDLLGDVLTLRHRDVIHVAVALDFYKDPKDGVDPLQWPNTAAGELVRKAKYWDDGNAFDALVGRLVHVASG